MNSVGNKLPGNAYKQFLFIGENNTGIESAAKVVYSGDGIESPLYLSTTKVGIGTDTPAAELDVIGQIVVNGIVIFSNPSATLDGSFIVGDGGTGLTNAETPAVTDYDGQGYLGYHGKYNTLVGMSAGAVMSTGFNNIAIGSYAMLADTSGSLNMAIGAYTLSSNTTGNDNAAIGVWTLYSNVTGKNNTGIGNSTLFNSTADYNTAIGYSALFTNATGSGNTAIGYMAGYHETASNKLFIDNQPRANEASGRSGALIYGIFDATPANQSLYFNASVQITQGLTVLGGIAPRVSTEASSVTPTINADSVDFHSITALAANITSMTTNLSGTPANFQRLIIRIKDNGTGRTIVWGASYEAAGTDLPATTTASKLLTLGFLYNSVTSKWGCVSSIEES